MAVYKEVLGVHKPCIEVISVSRYTTPGCGYVAVRMSGSPSREPGFESSGSPSREPGF